MPAAPQTTIVAPTWTTPMLVPQQMIDSDACAVAGDSDTHATTDLGNSVSAGARCRTMDVPIHPL